MKPEKYSITRKLASCLLLASFVISSLSLHPIIVQAQTNSAQKSEGAQTLSFLPAVASDKQSATWSLDYDLSATGAQAAELGGSAGLKGQVENMLSAKNLKSHGVDYSIEKKNDSVYKVHLKGSGNLGSMRAVLFTGLQPEMDLLGGPVALDLTAPVKKGQAIPVVLESRPATGYTWQIDEKNSTLVAQAKQPVLKSEADQPSAPARQTIQLKGKANGKATIHLVYRRAWDSAKEVTRHLSVQMTTMPAQVDLSSPVKVQTVSPSDLSDMPTVGEPTVSLPASFDWRGQGKTPPVRDQGSCGGCWAFGTVGAMEMAMMVQANTAAPDLSEQFLISCNKDNWSCNGGWWAHDYHKDKLANNQSTAGAVLERDDPYTASNGSCSINYAKTGKIANWGYVNGSYNSIPSPDQLKNTIYTYGSAAVSVCVGPAWNSYKGGVFATDESGSCGGAGGVNHAVVLVGWDDAGQYWIMRNSWGPNWGESGYMRIKWGTSNIGYGASYVVYSSGSPLAPTPTTAPTQAPTATRVPTQVPTATRVPTQVPTATRVPTQVPTATKAPTQPPAPTQAPTKAPTQAPTKAPTQPPAPTQAPTKAPTQAPTQAPAGLANDNLNNATSINYSGGITTYTNSENTSAATTESTDPYFPFTTKSKGYHSVWYKFSPFYRGTVALNTKTSGYDTILGVWTKRADGTLALVRWNDNASLTRQSSLSYTANAGTTYYIEVASKTATAGQMVFNFKYTPVIPANDRLGYTTLIPNKSGAAVNYTSTLDVGRTTVTTDEPVLPDGRGRNYRTVWYKFTAVKSGTVAVTSMGSNYDTVLAAWKYVAGKWQAIGMNDNWNGQIAGFQMSVTAGVTYRFGLSSNSATGSSKAVFNFTYNP